MESTIIGYMYILTSDVGHRSLEGEGVWGDEG